MQGQHSDYVIDMLWALTNLLSYCPDQILHSVAVINLRSRGWGGRVSGLGLKY